MAELIDKDTLAELVFINENLQKNIKIIQEIGDFGTVAKNFSDVQFLSADIIQKHVERIDWGHISKLALNSSQAHFEKANHDLQNAIKSFEEAQSKAIESIQSVDMKVLHETADGTQAILKNQRKLKTKNLFFIVLGSLIFMFFLFGYGLRYFNIILDKKQTYFLETASKFNLSSSQINKNMDYVYVPSTVALKLLDTEDPNWKILEIKK